PGSGRSTALGTIVEAALRGGTPVHLIAEDAERWPGAEAPAAGTWCPIADPRRLRRLLQRLLDGDGPGLLVLDDVDAIAESLEETGPLGEGADLLLTVLRRARRLGLDVALSAAESARRWAMAADRGSWSPQDGRPDAGCWSSAATPGWHRCCCASRSGSRGCIPSWHRCGWRRCRRSSDSATHRGRQGRRRRLAPPQIRGPVQI